MFTAKVKVPLLDHRLDAGFYHPAYVTNEQLLRSSGLLLEPLREAAFKMKCGPFGSSLHASAYVNNGIPFIQPVSFSRGSFDQAKIEYITEQDNARLASTAFEAPALVFARVGDPCCAVVPANVRRFNLHGDVIGVKCKGTYDDHFVCAFLHSSYGSKELRRYSAGSTRPRTNTDSLAEILVLQLHKSAQRYIGDKLRQAEAMMDHSRRLRDEISSLLSPFNASEGPNGRTSRVTSADVAETLNANAYMERFVHAQRIVDQYPHHTIAQLSRSVADGPFGSNLTVTDYRDGARAQHPVVRVMNCEGGIFNREELVWIDSAKQTELSRSEVLPGDLLVTKAGRIGSAAVYPEDLPPGNITSHLIRARIKPPIDAFYIAEYLETRVGRALTLRHSFKSTRPELTKKEIEVCPIPLLPDIEMEQISNDARLKSRLVETSRILTKAATMLVESLVDGIISEDEMVEAQRALESGDCTLDRHILAKLTTNGIDVASAAKLFTDVDPKLMESWGCSSKVAAK